MSEDLIFASEEEALQHLADETGKQIVIATDLEDAAKAVGENKSQLQKRLQRAKSILKTQISKQFGNGKFDFAKKCLVSDDGKMVLQWKLRNNPDKAEDSHNQQTSMGTVDLIKVAKVAAEDKASPSEVSEFTDAYIEAMLWSSTDDPNDIDKENLDDNYGKEDIAPEFMKEIKSDCEKFVKENYEFIQRDIGGAGYDFWLTRAGHGAGFWDGDWKEEIDGKNAGDHLTEMSKAYKEISPYAGDDKLVYGM